MGLSVRAFRLLQCLCVRSDNTEVNKVRDYSVSAFTSLFRSQCC